MMPLLSQLFIRASLLYLAAGFTLGAIMLIHKGIPLHEDVWRLLPIHAEFLLVGWIIQLTLGVAFRILPRFWQPPARGDERGAWLAFFLLNGGIWLVVAGALLTWPAATLLGRLAEVGAAVAFAVHIWPRIVARE